MISEPRLRISAWSSPTALLSASSERKLFEQTSSARPSVWCAGVISPEPRISERRTFQPASASCHAASDPARPPPRSEEHTSELQSLMRTSYAVFCLNKKIQLTPCLYSLPTLISTYSSFLPPPPPT